MAAPAQRVRSTAHDFSGPRPPSGSGPPPTTFFGAARGAAPLHLAAERSGTFDMGRNILVINVDIRETRVALIENGIIAELHLERESSKGTLGNIYLGKVSRVLPGMQAAFIDVGLERAAFLHVEDLIRPDDFEAYLQGHRRGSEEERETRSSDDEEAAPPVADRRPIDALTEDDDDEVIVSAAAGDVDADDDGPLMDDPVADEVAEEVEADSDAVYSAASEVAAHEAELEDEPSNQAFDADDDEAAALDAGEDLDARGRRRGRRRRRGRDGRRGRRRGRRRRRSWSGALRRRRCCAPGRRRRRPHGGGRPSRPGRR